MTTITKPNRAHQPSVPPSLLSTPPIYLTLFQHHCTLHSINSLTTLPSTTFGHLAPSSMIPDPLQITTLIILSSPTTKSSVRDGGPRSFATPRGHISTVPWLPLRHCPPLDHHLQPQRNLLLLLPLGQVTLLPSKLLQPCTLSHSIPTQHGCEAKQRWEFAGVDARWWRA